MFIGLLFTMLIVYCVIYFRKKFPDVSQHMTNLDMPWALVVTKWFICLFAEVLPIEVFT